MARRKQRQPASRVAEREMSFEGCPMKETGNGQQLNPAICGVAKVGADLQFGPLCQSMPN
jgi:hypothetical protein